MKVDAADGSREMAKGGEERVQTPSFGSIEYTVQYVSSFRIYSAAGELG
jgi:hypothetical protein